ncbi:MAG: hypothetical protein R3F61_03485 [Myxococcota bacterium]
MRASALVVLALSAGCSAPAPEPVQSVRIEVVGDGPRIEPRRTSTGDSWMLALDALNSAPPDTLAHNR